MGAPAQHESRASQDSGESATQRKNNKNGGHRSLAAQVEAGSCDVPAKAPHPHGAANERNHAFAPRVVFLSRFWPQGAHACGQAILGCPEPSGSAVPPLPAAAQNLASAPPSRGAPAMDLTGWVLWRGSGLVARPTTHLLATTPPKGGDAQSAGSWRRGRPPCKTAPFKAGALGHGT